MSSPRAGERARWRTSRPRTTSRRYVWVFFEHPTRAARPRYAVSTRTRPHARPSPDARLTATLRFPPRHGRHIPQAFSPLNFGDLDVEQQADALFSKVRLPSGFASPRSPRTPRRPTLAPPHVASFSESANTSLRVFVDRRKHASDAFFLDASRAALLRDAKQGPMRTLSARTFETLLDESNVRENEVRTRPANEPRYAPNARFLVRNEPFAFPPNLAPEKRAWRRAVDARRPTRAPHVAHFRIGTLFRFSDNVSIRRRSVFARARGDALDRSFPRSFPRSVCCAPLRLDAPRIVIDHARELFAD